jgi:hypothetical protein
MFFELLARMLKRSFGSKSGAVGLACACAPMARAALWENSLWSVSGEAAATAGYDSNLEAINGGSGDWFASYRPSLKLARTHSLLDFEAEAWTDWSTFLKETNDDSFDPGLRLTLSYPANVDSMPTQMAEVHWIRSTAVNVDVGQRVSQDDAFAKYEGDLFNTGKTSIAGRASFDQDAYLGGAFDTVETASAGGTLGYSPHDLFKAGVGYDLTYAQSRPNSPGPGALNQTEHAFTIQADGEFTPNLSGKFSAGTAYSHYSGSFSLSVWEAVALADLTWKPAERLAIELQAARAPNFSVQGYVDLTSSLGLEVRQTLSHGFTVRADARGGVTDHQLTTTFRTDHIEGASGGLDYDLTGKLTASGGYDWTRQDSDIALYTYRRQVVSGRILYKF